MNPKVAPSVFVYNLKAVSSLLIHKDFGEELVKAYWRNRCSGAAVIASSLVWERHCR
ncbi:MAG: hypothetical protein KGI54_02315 [Pseudomonadota bacterium]|nr:hypothetical protein [Pseudomonadota bacterium]